MNENLQAATEVARAYFGNLVWGGEPSVLIGRITAALDEAEARGRAERDEQTGIVVAALVARAELAEAVVRRVDELCAVADEQPDGYECRFIAMDLIRATLVGENR